EGLPLAEAVQEAGRYPQVFAAGANCFKLAWAVDVVKNLRQASQLPVVVYPNSGAEYDPAVKEWVYPAEAADFGQAAAEWLQAGASLVGGCCTTMPADIAKVAAAVKAFQA
ncbi:homocysteine S-methyltransferase family protein, partial [Lactobacillus nasalidis]